VIGETCEFLNDHKECCHWRTKLLSNGQRSNETKTGKALQMKD